MQWLHANQELSSELERSLLRNQAYKQEVQRLTSLLQQHNIPHNIAVVDDAVDVGKVGVSPRISPQHHQHHHQHEHEAVENTAGVTLLRRRMEWQQEHGKDHKFDPMLMIDLQAVSSASSGESSDEKDAHVRPSLDHSQISQRSVDCSSPILLTDRLTNDETPHQQHEQHEHEAMMTTEKEAEAEEEVVVASSQETIVHTDYQIDCQPQAMEIDDHHTLNIDATLSSISIGSVQQSPVSALTSASADDSPSTDSNHNKSRPQSTGGGKFLQQYLKRLSSRIISIPSSENNGSS